MRVLFASYMRDASSSGHQRLHALEALGHEVIPFRLDGYDRMSAAARKLGRFVRAPFFRHEDLVNVGRAFSKAVAGARAELVWVEKPLMLLPEFIDAARKLVPHATFVCFQDDDPFGTRHLERPSWRHFVDSIPAWHVHFVKRRQNVEEFETRGARHVLLFTHGVHRPLFYPRAASLASRAITFVGTPLDHRVPQIAELLRADLPLDVYGNRWERTAPYWRYRQHFHPAITGADYATLLSESKICLGFVSSSNRDEWSMRTFEVPGSGSLFLAERTPAHQELFEEGCEAEFFGSVEECVNKCAYYMRNEAVRARVAAAGLARCIRSEYILERRMRDALEEVQALGPP
jgi:spore maturation protein CgeB